MANGLTRVVVREQNPKVRATNFDEVCYGYNKEEAMEEAARCLNCKKPKCVEGERADLVTDMQEVKHYYQQGTSGSMWTCLSAGEPVRRKMYPRNQR